MTARLNPFQLTSWWVRGLGVPVRDPQRDLQGLHDKDLGFRV